MAAGAHERGQFEEGYWRGSGKIERRLPQLSAATIDGEEFRLLADNIPTLCWVANGDGYIVWYNRCWHEYCGTTPEEMEGWGWQSVHDPRVLPTVMERWTSSIATGGPFEMTFPLRGADGLFRPFLTRVQPIRDESGEIVRWFGVNTEIGAQVAAEQRFRTVLEASTSIIWTTDPSGAFVHPQPAWEKYTGQQWPDHSGFGWAEMIHANDRDRITKEWATAVKKGEPYSTDGRVWNAETANYHHFIVRAGPVRDPAGRVIEWVGAITDIERQVSAEAEEQRAKLEREALAAEQAAILSQLTEGVIVADAEGRIMFVNEAAEQLHGVKRLDVAPDEYSETYHLFTEDGRAYPSDQLPLSRAVMSGETVIDERWRIRRPDGSEIIAIGSARPLKIGGESAGAVLTLRDDTKRLTAEQALRESEQRLRLVQSIGRIGSFDYDLQKDEAACSDEYYQIYGLEPGTRINLELGKSLTHPDDLQRTLDHFERAIAERSPFNQEYRIMRADNGEVRWVSVSAAMLLDDKGEPWRYVGGAQDITHRKNAEQALRESEAMLEQRVREEIDRRAEAEEALRQSQKMETVGQLTGGIAHDFNNLLQIVSGNLDTLLRKLPDAAEPVRRYAERAMIGADRAATLTQRLLAFSRRQPLAPRAADVNKLVAGMSELLHRTLGETVEVETVLAPRLWPVEVDPNQLENSLINLAVNARDAMPDGGKLTIETQNTHLDKSYASQHPEVAEGQYVVICISDTGQGMDEEVVARAIEPFFTTKEVGRGTGLGLSMAYGFVKQSDGHLKIYSEPGEGTTVKIYLPRLTGAIVDEIGPSTACAPAGAGEETILVCEDDDEVRAFSVEALSELGYRVLQAADGPSALRVLSENRGQVDLLFTDVVLPGGMTGAVLARQAVELEPKLKTLFTTGYARNAIVHQGRLDPGVELLTKPFTHSDLALRVRDILDRAS